MPQENTTTNTNDMLEKRLSAIEQLLVEQKQQNAKLVRQRTILSALILCLVVVCAMGLFALNLTVSNAAQGLPQLTQNANRMVESTSAQLEAILTDISDIDFDALNNAVQELESGVSAVDFEALGSSIENLEAVSESLANLTSIFGR